MRTSNSASESDSCGVMDIVFLSDFGFDFVVPFEKNEAIEP